MTKPRYIVPGRIYFVTRRVLGRRFRLKPDPVTKHIVLYVLAAVAARYGVEILGVVVMSNHVHCVVYDPEGRLSDFLRDLESMVAKALNRYHRTRDTFWDGAKAAVVHLADAGAVVEKLAYCAANPVKAGLVERGREWEGLRTHAKDYGKTVRVSRPTVYFSRHSERLPEAVDFRVHLPPDAWIETARPPEGEDEAAWRRGQFIHQLETAIHDHEERARTKVRGEGRTFLGAAACRAVDPFDHPATPDEPTRYSEVAATDEAARKRMRQELRRFRASYREARAEFIAGHRDVRWPEGTWLKARQEGCPAAGEGAAAGARKPPGD